MCIRSHCHSLSINRNLIKLLESVALLFAVTYHGHHRDHQKVLWTLHHNLCSVCDKATCKYCGSVFVCDLNPHLHSFLSIAINCIVFEVLLKSVWNQINWKGKVLTHPRTLQDISEIWMWDISLTCVISYLFSQNSLTEVKVSMHLLLWQVSLVS
jgi:hypothetical protein